MTALGGGATTSGTFTRLDGVVSGLPVSGGASGTIVDFGGGGRYCSWVLYSNGDLYRLGSSAILAAKNITMFDASPSSNSTGTYIRAVNSSNQILYRLTSSTTVATSSSPSNGWSTYTPTGTVTQIRAGGYNAGWGYLNSAGTLYLSSSSSSTAPTLSNATPTGTTMYSISNVSYFDLNGVSGNITYGIVQSGTTKLWGHNSYGAIGGGSTSTYNYASPFTPSNVDTSYMPDANRDISNTPPATCFLLFNILLIKHYLIAL